MAVSGLLTDDSTQSFVVLTKRTTPGQVRGTIRHVQSKDQHGFTRWSQAQAFIEQRLESPLAPRQSTGQPARPIGLSRKFRLAAATVLILVLAGASVFVSRELPVQWLAGAAVGDGGKIILALLIGLVLGSLGSYVWWRGSQRG